MGHTLEAILDAAAAGRFPPPDGGTTVVPQPSPRDVGVIAFTAHSVVFTDEDPHWVHSALGALECDGLAASMNPRFLAALLDRTGRTTDTIDLLTVAASLPGDPPLELRQIADPDHPRVRRALRRRDDVRVWAADGECSSSAAAWPGAGRRRSRWTRPSATGVWAGSWPAPHAISSPTAARSGPSRPRATPAASAPSRPPGSAPWAPRPCCCRSRSGSRGGR